MAPVLLREFDPGVATREDVDRWTEITTENTMTRSRSGNGLRLVGPPSRRLSEHDREKRCTSFLAQRAMPIGSLIPRPAVTRAAGPEPRAPAAGSPVTSWPAAEREGLPLASAYLYWQR